MKNFYITFIAFLLFLPSFLFGETRSELLEEGRQSMNVVQEYDKIKSIDVKTIYFDLYFKSYHPYTVDTFNGEDSARVLLGGMNLIFNTAENGRLIFIGQFFWLSSDNRKKVVDGESVLISYGVATDFYLGYDQVILNYILLQGGGIFSISKLNDTKVDSGQTLPGGGTAYEEVSQGTDLNVEPVFGVHLFNFPLIQLGSTLAYSFKKKRITSSNTILKMEFSKFFDDMGDVEIGYKTYSFLENDQAFVFRWVNIFNIFSFGTEVFKSSNKIGEIFIEVNVGILGLIKRYKREKRRKNKKNTVNNEQNNGEPLNTPTGEIKSKVKGSLRTSLRDPINRNTELYVFIRLNYARTPETEELTGSKAMLFGWKMGLKFTFLKSMSVEAYYLHNLYSEMLLFKHSVNKHGFSFRFTAFY